MATVYMMIGLPASGKSTKAKELAVEKDAVIVSSDQMRSELFDRYSKDDNTALFDEVNKRIVQLLNDGNNVIYDATNTNRKKRKHFVSHIARGHRVVAYYMNTPYHLCVHRNLFRENKVPMDYILRLYKTLHVPAFFEGFDGILIDGEISHHANRFDFEILLSENIGYDNMMDVLDEYIPEFGSVWELPHDSKYHSFSVSRHIYHVYDHLYKASISPESYIQMLTAGVFHDLGKGFCKSFTNMNGEPTRYAHYYGHENVSAQLAVNALRGMKYGHHYILEVAELVSLHMMMMNAESEKAKVKLQNMVGENTFRQLCILHEADTLAK